MLFYLGLTFSYVYAYFDLGFDSASDPFAIFIRVSIDVGNY